MNLVLLSFVLPLKKPFAKFTFTININKEDIFLKSDRYLYLYQYQIYCFFEKSQIIKTHCWEEHIAVHLRKEIFSLPLHLIWEPVKPDLSTLVLQSEEDIVTLFCIVQKNKNSNIKYIIQENGFKLIHVFFLLASSTSRDHGFTSRINLHTLFYLA